MEMLKFPHHKERVLGGCISLGVTEAPKLVCAECKKAYSDWVSLDKAEANKQIPPLGSPLPYTPTTVPKPQLPAR